MEVSVIRSSQDVVGARVSLRDEMADVVYASEIDPPAWEEPVKWRLVTTEPINTAAGAAHRRVVADALAHRRLF